MDGVRWIPMAGLLVVSIGGGSAAATPAQETPVYWTVEEVIAHSPQPWPSQAVGDDLMDKYSSDQNLVDVFLDGPHDVRVVLKGAVPEVSTVGDITVTTVGAKYSMSDLNGYATALIERNPFVHEVKIGADGATLTAIVPTTATELGVDRATIPEDVTVGVEPGEPVVLDAAEGGATVSGTGCTTGFRFRTAPNTWRLSSANHSACGDAWGSVNGVAMTRQGGVCAIDTSIASGSPTSTVIQGMPFTGVQSNPASGSLVYKYGTKLAGRTASAVAPRS